jgi:hypothetical protein
MEHTHTEPGGRKAGSARKPEHPLIPAGRVTGTAVYNPEGDRLGKVEEVAIEKVTGKVAYAILSFGGILGLGERYYPVPWKMLHYDTGHHGYVVPLDKAALDDAPSFEPHELGGWDDTHIRDNIYDYYSRYGVSPWM